MSTDAKLEDAVTGQCKWNALTQENRFNVIDRTSHHALQIAQRWKDVVAAERCTLSENYVEGRFALICNLEISFSGREDGFSYSQTGHFGNGKCATSLVYVANLPDPMKVRIADKDPVFIFDVEVMNGPDLEPISSLVGLYDIADEVNDPFGGLMFESAVNGGYKFIPSIAHRKLGVRSSFSGSGELYVVGNVIESSPEVVKGVSNNAHEILWNGFTWHEMKRIVSGVRISLDLDRVRVIVDGNKNIAQLTDVLFGPLDL